MAPLHSLRLSGETTLDYHGRRPAPVMSAAQERHYHAQSCIQAVSDGIRGEQAHEQSLELW